MEAATIDPRYPIGKYHRVKDATPEMRRQAIGEIAVAPARLRAAVVGLSEEHSETPYRRRRLERAPICPHPHRLPSRQNNMRNFRLLSCIVLRYYGGNVLHGYLLYNVSTRSSNPLGETLCRVETFDSQMTDILVQRANSAPRPCTIPAAGRAASRPERCRFHPCPR